MSLYVKGRYDSGEGMTPTDDVAWQDRRFDSDGKLMMIRRLKIISLDKNHTIMMK